MSISSAEQALKTAGRSRDTAVKRHTDAVKKQGTLENEIGKLEDRAARTNSDSQRASYGRQISGKQEQLSRARTDVTARLSDSTKASEKVTVAEAKLRTEEQNEKKRQERVAAQKKRQDEQKKRQDDAAERRSRQREEAAQTAVEAARDAREAAQDHKITELEHRLEESSREAAPADVAVLLIASSPEDQQRLRLDKETREIEKRVRAADYRDSIYFRPKMARQLPDLLDDLNEVRPTVLHFSGHGDEDSLAFEGPEGKTRLLDNAMLVELLEATPGKVRLIVFNSCDSAAQARVAIAHVDVAIGMETAIEDEDAKVFAGQFYNSLGFGNSVGAAFRQARFQLGVDGTGAGAGVPQIFSAEGVDPETVVLVNPDAD
jgi:hypothetical protein